MTIRQKQGLHGPQRQWQEGDADKHLRLGLTIWFECNRGSQADRQHRQKQDGGGLQQTVVSSAQGAKRQRACSADRLRAPRCQVSQRLGASGVHRVGQTERTQHPQRHHWVKGGC